MSEIISIQSVLVKKVYCKLNRQLAVKAVAPACQLLLVVGSQNSSNSRRMVEVCRNTGTPAYLVDDERDLKPEWLTGVNTVTVTAGASAPEYLVQKLIENLQQSHGFDHFEEFELKDEDVRFSLPNELQAASSSLTQIAL